MLSRNTLVNGLLVGVLGAIMVYFAQYYTDKMKNEEFRHIEADSIGGTRPDELQTVTRTVIETVTSVPKVTALRDSFTFSKLVFFTIARKGEFGQLRELVGSIHKLRPLGDQQAPLIYVYGFRLLKREIHEMSLWCNVFYQNLEEAFSPSSLISLDKPLSFNLSEKYLADESPLRDILIRRLQTAHKLVIFMKNGHVIWEDRLTKLIDDLLLKKHLVLLSTYDKSVAVAASIGIFEGTAEDIFASEYGIDEGAPSDDDEYGNANSCQICIRESAHNEWKLFHADNIRPLDSEKIKVGLLIPTTSKRTKELWSLPFLSIFLATLPKTITDREKSKYSLHFYLGYDEEDPIYDNEVNLSIISSKVNRTLAELGILGSLKIVRIGISKAVTYIWNSLFSIAYTEGCEYFYQLNDDVRFVGVGWLDAFVTELKKQNDFGVVGPHDPAFSCNIMTQAMVSRRHFDTFGWLFPPDFINWHCDTWLSLVYANWTRCFDKMIIWNGRYEKKGNLPRYRACKKIEFKPLTLFYQQKYLKNSNGSFKYVPQKSNS